MAQTPTDPTKAQVWITKGIDDLDFEFYIPSGPKGDPGGIVLGTQLSGTSNLNDYKTSGVYRLGTTYSGLSFLNFPRDTDSGVLVVYERVVNQTLVQEWHSMQLQGRGFYIRHMTNTDVWSTWRFVTTARVDQTAGRAIYHWDDLNNRDQRIYGDTGWRDVASGLINGALASIFHIKRVNDTVFVKISGLQLPTTAVADPIYTFPTGFIPDSQYGMLREQINNGNAYGFVVSSNIQLYGNIPGGTAANNTTNRFQGMLMGHCSSVWPTTLPGSAVGAVVNS